MEHKVKIGHKPNLFEMAEENLKKEVKKIEAKVESKVQKSVREVAMLSEEPKIFKKKMSKARAKESTSLFVKLWAFTCGKALIIFFSTCTLFLLALVILSLLSTGSSKDKSPADENRADVVKDLDKKSIKCSTMCLKFSE